MTDSEKNANNKRERDDAGAAGDAGEPKSDSPAKRGKPTPAEAPRALGGGDGAVALRVTGGELLYGSWSGALLGSGKEASSTDTGAGRVQALNGAWRQFKLVMEDEEEGHGVVLAHESLDDEALVELVTRVKFNHQDDAPSADRLDMDDEHWAKTKDAAAAVVGGAEAAGRAERYFNERPVAADAARFEAAVRPVIDEAARAGKVGGQATVPQEVVGTLGGDAAVTLDWDFDAEDDLFARVLLDADGGAAHVFMVYDRLVAEEAFDEWKVTLLGQIVSANE